MLQKTTISSKMKFSVLHNNSGTAMLLVLVVAIIGNILVGSVLLTSRYSTKKSTVRREKVSVINIAEAGKEHFYAKLIHEKYVPYPDSVELVIDKEPFGKGCYSVHCSTGTGIDTMSLKVKADEGDNSSKIEVQLTKLSPIPSVGFSLRIRGTIISRSSVHLLGNITVDGRNHDSATGALSHSSDSSGTFGIYTFKYVNVDGSSAVGGNGIAPADKKTIDAVHFLVCKDSLAYDSNKVNLNSPESFFKLPEHGLDEYMITAANLAKKLPFQGLYYVTEDLEIDLSGCTGVLIVHNTDKTAKLKCSKGNFKGLIICDVMDIFNGGASVLGSVIVLGNSDATFGNGTATVNYCKSVLDNLNAYCTNIHWKVQELSWREVTD